MIMSSGVTTPVAGAGNMFARIKEMKKAEGGPPPKVKSLKYLLAALDSKPWHREEVEKPRSRFRPHSAGGLLNGKPRRRSADATGGGAAAQLAQTLPLGPGATMPLGSSGTVPGRPSTSEAPRKRRPVAVPPHMKTVLTQCERELTYLLAQRRPPEQFQFLFITLLILVSPADVSENYFTWVSSPWPETP